MDVKGISFVGADLSVRTKISESNAEDEEKAPVKSSDPEDLISSLEDFINSPPLNIAIHDVNVKFDDIHILADLPKGRLEYNGPLSLKSHIFTSEKISISKCL